MHEVFLCRLVSHPVFRNDHNLRVFLEYDQDLWVRGKNRMEVLGGFMKSFSDATDELLLSATVKDVSEFFEQEKTFLIKYHSHLKDATAKADSMTKKHKGNLFSVTSVAYSLFFAPGIAAEFMCSSYRCCRCLYQDLFRVHPAVNY